MNFRTITASKTDKSSITSNLQPVIGNNKFTIKQPAGVRNYQPDNSTNSSNHRSTFSLPQQASSQQISSPLPDNLDKFTTLARELVALKKADCHMTWPKFFIEIQKKGWEIKDTRETRQQIREARDALGFKPREAKNFIKSLKQLGITSLEEMIAKDETIILQYTNAPIIDTQSTLKPKPVNISSQADDSISYQLTTDELDKILQPSSEEEQNFLKLATEFPAAEEASLKQGVRLKIGDFLEQNGIPNTDEMRQKLYEALNKLCLGHAPRKDLIGALQRLDEQTPLGVNQWDAILNEPPLHYSKQDLLTGPELEKLFSPTPTTQELPTTNNSSVQLKGTKRSLNPENISKRQKTDPQIADPVGYLRNLQQELNDDTIDESNLIPENSDENQLNQLDNLLKDPSIKFFLRNN